MKREKMRFSTLLSIFIGLSCFFDIASKPVNAVVAPQAGPPLPPPSSPKKVKNINYEISFGDPRSRIKIVMYFSPTCTHCSEYEEKILPDIKKQFIKVGKVYFVMRLLPFHKLDYAVAKFIWSRGAEKVYELSQLFLSHQDEWLTPVTYEKKDKSKALKRKLKNLSSKLKISVKELRDQLGIKEGQDDAFLRIFAFENSFTTEEIQGILVDNAELEEALTENHIQAGQDFGEQLSYVPAFMFKDKPHKGWVKLEDVKAEVEKLS